MNHSLSYRMSLWAKNHRPLAITVIVISKILLAMIGFTLGMIAWCKHITLPAEATLQVLAVIGVITVIMYPERQLKQRMTRESFYWRQKSIDGVLVTLGFACFVLLGNVTPAWTSQPTIPSSSLSTSITTLESSLEKPVSERRKELVKGGKLKQWAMKKAKSKLARTIARFEKWIDGKRIVDVILVSLFLLLACVAVGYGIIWLACSLACGGQEVLAIIVLVIGIPGVLALLYFGLRSIFRRRKKYHKTAVPQAPEPIE